MAKYKIFLKPHQKLSLEYLTA